MGGDEQKGPDDEENLIFMAVDKVDKVATTNIRTQVNCRSTADSTAPRGFASGFDENKVDFAEATKGALEELAAGGLASKADRQLSRVEFMMALVKAAIEKYIKTKQNPHNELDDVSEAVDCLFSECIEVRMFTVPPGKCKPRIPRPDEFREQVCYHEPISMVLARLAPSLRVIFAGLARVSYELSRSSGSSGGALPKITRTKLLHPAMDATWVALSGCISLFVWRTFIGAVGFKGAELREVTLCFVYSVMCVKDASWKERHLPFEGFLEAIVRLATCVPIPTDQELKTSEYTHAGAYMAGLASGDAETFQRYADSQACEWGDVPDESLCGPMPKRVENLVDILLRAIKQPVEPDAPLGGMLTRREFRQWAGRSMRLDLDKYLPESWAQESEAGEC